MKKTNNLMLWFALALMFFIAACSQNSAPINQQNPPPPSANDGDAIQYKGPNPTSEDVQRYLVNVWSNLALDERCGACHIEGGQSPQFVRRDNIDAAYAEAIKIVDLQAPSLSRMVTKVAAGHNCWRAEASVCADTLITWLEAWANAAGVSGNVIVLTPPDVKTVGTSLPYPADSSHFKTLIYDPILRRYCANCHAADGLTPQQPYFAGGDADAAYAAAKSKMNLSQPANSRMVVRLREEAHNCWAQPSRATDCATSSGILEQAIESFASTITPAEVNADLVISNALALGADGIVASAGGRFEPNVSAKYEFKTGSGDVAFDTSGQDPALDLRLSGNVSWLEGGVWGLRFAGGRAQASTAASKKLYQQIRFTGEYSIEAWVAPGNVTQEGPARIVSYSGGDETRNFTLGQTLYNYNFMNRTSETSLDGQPMLSTPNADEVLQATLQHVVVTFNIIEGRRIYVNGELISTDDLEALGEGSLETWDDTFAFVLGLETSGKHSWMGSMRFLAVHNRALKPEQVLANYEAGVGEKFFLLFRVTDALGVGAIPAGTDAYVVFEVEPFDSYSYLFANPFFYLLDPNKTPVSAPPVPLQNIVLQGMRIGVNGREVQIGQGFATLNITIKPADYVAGEGLALSRLGALIPVEQGKELDEFFLSFDALGGKHYDRPADVVPKPPTPDDTAEASLPADIGIKTFAQINANLAQMTGVATTQPSVRATYEKVQQQLPADANIEGFLPAHHMGVTQLAVAYCNALVSDINLRANLFANFKFTALPNDAFDVNGRAVLLEGLQKALVIVSPSSQALTSGPTPLAMSNELNSLIDKMTACGGNCTVGTTTSTATAVCAAALGSAAMLVQ